MQSVSIRDLTHGFSHYLKEVKGGEAITVLERNVPVADLVPHNKNLLYPGWKRNLKRRKIKGESFAMTTIKSRNEQ
ncbi:MAG: hypothetical protein PHC61_03835 [Chitinivibrionales bacterium]|nr:hypothetical protein [Chitinivibrionales bacterium]